MQLASSALTPSLASALPPATVLVQADAHCPEWEATPWIFAWEQVGGHNPLLCKGSPGVTGLGTMEGFCICH